MLKQKKIFFLLLVCYGLFVITSLSIAQVKIAVLYSKLSELHSQTNSKNIIEEITSWELFLMQNNIQYKVIYDDDLESGVNDEFDILILPSVEFISELEVKELRNFLLSGKSVINVGSKLFYLENSINMFQNSETLFGLSNIENVPAENISYFHSISTNHLNHFISDYDRVLQISTSNEPLMCDEIENKNLAYGYVILDSNFISNKSSVIYGTLGSGKYLWTGFELNDVVGGNSDLEQVHKLILNTIKWMDNEPDVYLSLPWAEGMAPSILTVEFNNALASQLVEVLQKNNFSPNLIVKPQQKISKEVLRNFSDEQIILDLSENPVDYYVNLESLENLITTFERDNEIRASTIILDISFNYKINLKSLKNIGIENILLPSEVTGNTKQNSEDLFILPFSKTGSNSKSNRQVRFIHYIPKINCDENTEDELLVMLNKIDKTQIAFTTINKIREWYNKKNNLDVKIISDLGNSIAAQVTNKNSVEINNLKLYVNTNGTIDKRNISVTSNNILLEHYFEQDSGTIVITIDKLSPNSSNKITISIDDN